jgi:hypothetical protein
VRTRLPQQSWQGRVLFRLTGRQRSFRSGENLDQTSAPALVEPEAVHEPDAVNDQRVIRRRGRSFYLTMLLAQPVRAGGAGWWQPARRATADW